LNRVNARIAWARHGHLLGGEGGRGLIARAHAELSAEGINKPELWVRLVTPASLRD
jgi:hypothetical protein